MALAKSFSLFEQLIVQMEDNIESISRALAITSTIDAVSPAVAVARLEYVKQLWHDCRALHWSLLKETDASLEEKHPYFTNRVFASTELMVLEGCDLLHTRAALEALRPTSGDNLKVDSNRHVVQVPRISLPSFSGSFREWPSFRDYFQSLILNDESFDDLQRFHYLKSCLEGEPFNLIKNINTTAVNFTGAWNQLLERYDNKRGLLTIHISSLFDVPSVNQESAVELRKLVDAFNESMQSLRNMNRPVEHWDDLLIYLFLTKVDKQTRKAWEMRVPVDVDFPTFSDLILFMNARVRALESVATPLSGHPDLLSTKRKVKARVLHLDASSPTCTFCDKSGHSIYSCKLFEKSSLDKRFDTVKKRRLCLNCLNGNHQKAQCSSTRNCRRCGQRHHTLLHRETPAGAGQVVSDQSAVKEGPSVNTSGRVETSMPLTQSLSCHSSGMRQSYAMLATAWVHVSGSSYRNQSARAILDQGSTHTLITERLSRALQLRSYPISVCLNGIGDLQAGNVTRVVPITVSSLRDQVPCLSTDALVLPTLTSYVPRKFMPCDNWPHLHGITLADPDPGSNAPIDLIIGADLYAYVLRDGLRRGSVEQPVAQDTIFGWVISGRTVTAEPQSGPEVHSHFTHGEEALGNILSRFWEIEEQIQSNADPDQDPCESHFIKTHTRTPEGRYVVRIPFKVDPPLPLGESRSRADRLLLAIEKRLARDTELRSRYSENLREYETQGHMVPIQDTPEESKTALYLSHHPVQKLSSSTTKVRVVFNASAPTSNGNSLNDVQWVGPKLQNDLPLLLVRWRAYKYVCCADIEGMYRQILVDERDQPYQRIRWRYSPAEAIQSYQLKTVTFGTASAPFLAQRVLLQLASDEGADFPLAAPIVRSNFYVDDCLFGTDDPILARDTVNQLIQLLQRGGFVLRKWASNSDEILNEIECANHGLASDRPLQPDDSIKVLGLAWCPPLDCYRFSVHITLASKITKRSVLSTIARLYDPLGWISPVIVTAKILMQSLWSLGLPWDDELREDIKFQWISYCDALPSLANLRIPRWTGQGPDIVSSELHGFADASIKAYAAVVYLRVVSCSGEISTRLIVSKTKVAPLKTQSVPRLELCAAVLLAKTLSSLEMVPEYASLPLWCWTDSTIVLAWLKREPASYNTFVANRVSQVQTLLKDATWRHVRSHDNPADLGSRGASATALMETSLWWKGPQFLSSDQSLWPPSCATAPSENQLELKAHASLVTPTGPDLSVFTKYSSWNRLIRVTAWIFRWRSRTQRSIPSSALLSAQEIIDASNGLLRQLQRVLFSIDYERLASGLPVSNRSALRNFDPFLDAEGLIRVGGRLTQAHLEASVAHPILLRSHPIVRLLIIRAHLRSLHGGLTLTLRHLRDEFWVLQAKKLIRSVIFKCVRCARIRAVCASEKMSALPAPRVLRPMRAFVHCGVDYAGPLQVRMAGGRGRKSHAAYIALFVCFAVKAVHIEVVSDYSSAAFLAAFNRFVSRRGLPSVMYSDRGTTFQGAERELQTSFESLGQNRICKRDLPLIESRGVLILPPRLILEGCGKPGLKV